MMTNWTESKSLRILLEEEEEVTDAEKVPPYNKLPDNEKQYALFTDGSCHIVGKH